MQEFSDLLNDKEFNQEERDEVRSLIKRAKNEREAGRLRELTLTSEKIAKKKKKMIKKLKK